MNGQSKPTVVTASTPRVSSSLVRWKKGVQRNVTTATAFWLGAIALEFEAETGETMRVTSAYRPGDPGAHGRKEGWDMGRSLAPQFDEQFCRMIQERYGRYVGVQLEPEWGKGAGYTGPHIHFQLKAPARRMFA